MVSIDKSLQNIFEELTLDEGIVFLKNSKRIRSLIKKIRSKATDLKNEELKAFIITLQRKARKFEEFEMDFSTADKEEKKDIKIRYKKFVARNKALVDKINSESFKKLLVVLGIIGLLATIIAVVFGLNALFIDKEDVEADDIKKDDTPTPEERIEQMRAKKFVSKPLGNTSDTPEQHKEIIKGGKEEDARVSANELRREKMHAVSGIKPHPKQYPAGHYDKEFADQYAFDHPSTDAALKKLVDAIAKESGVPPKLVRSIIQQESEWDVDNISRNKNGTKDMGLMQLNSRYIDYYKKLFWKSDKPFNPLSAKDNATIGIRYLAHLIKYYHGNTDLAVQAYNCGPTAVDAGKIPASTIAYLARVKRGA